MLVVLHQQHLNFIHEGVFLKISFEVIEAPEKIIVERYVRRKMAYHIAIEQDREKTNQYGVILKTGKDSKKSGHINFVVYKQQRMNSPSKITKDFFSC